MMDIGKLENLNRAKAAVDRICAEKGWDLKKISDFSKISGEIDARYDRRRYRCPICKDSGIVSWIDPDDGLFYGRRCGYCRYWDEQREQSRRREQGV